MFASNSFSLSNTHLLLTVYYFATLSWVGENLLWSTSAFMLHYITFNCSIALSLHYCSNIQYISKPNNKMINTIDQISSFLSSPSDSNLCIILLEMKCLYNVGEIKYQNKINYNQLLLTLKTIFFIIVFSISSM